MAVTCANGHSNLDGMAFCEECGVELTSLTDRAAAAISDSNDSGPSERLATSAGIGAAVTDTESSVAAQLAPQSTEAQYVPASPETAGQTLVAGDPPLESPDSSSVPSGPKDTTGAALPGRAYLAVVTGAFAGRQFPITAPTCTIGRWDMDSGSFPEIDLSEVDVDAKISRKHVRISTENDQYFIEDLGSLNGTSLNRAPRLLPGDRQPLHSNDELIVGRLFLKFVVG